jgi:thiamine-phosphate pyrophosphorylase
VPRAIICLVTADRGPRQPLLELVDAAAHAGVDMIQIRERRLDDRALLRLTRRAVALTRGTAARVVVNDRIDVALAAGASGVHLRGDSFAALRARALAPPEFLIGRSVHDPSEAAAADAAGGCDYLLFGTVFRSTSKPADHGASGVEALERVCRSVRLPVLAIGGISLENARQVARAGASGVAGISLFLGAKDALPATVAALRRAFDT